MQHAENRPFGSLTHWENLRKTKKQADFGLNPT